MTKKELFDLPTGHYELKCAYHEYGLDVEFDRRTNVLTYFIYCNNHSVLIYADESCVTSVGSLNIHSDRMPTNLCDLKIVKP